MQTHVTVVRDADGVEITLTRDMVERYLAMGWRLKYPPAEVEAKPKPRRAAKRKE